MLGDFLEGTEGWTPPAGMGDGAPVTHFGQRAAERGVASVHGDRLKWMVERALFEGRGDLIERVFQVCPETAAYRILLPEGPFYPIVRLRQGKARTIFDHAAIRDQRQGRRKRKKSSGMRRRRQASK